MYSISVILFVWTYYSGKKNLLSLIGSATNVGMGMTLKCESPARWPGNFSPILFS